MSSNINTNGIDVNYPTPGINNNSQGFRDNFATIKTNVTTAGVEITDLQNKVVVKSALANTSVNNDMAGTMISNTLTRGFRASTFNLGNALSGTVLVDVSLGDVQYGTISGNTSLTFTGWTTDGRNSVDLELAVSNPNAFLSFPSAISSDQCLGVTTLENYDSANNAVSIPAGVCQLDYTLSSVDCGANITIEPFNRPRRSTQIRRRSPAPTGLLGDIAGTVAVDANYAYVCTGTFDSNVSNTTTTLATATTTGTNLIVVGNTGNVTLNAPIIFSGTTFGGIVAGDVYYVKSIPTPGVGGTITISDTRTGGTTGPVPPGSRGTAGSVFPLSTDAGSMTLTNYSGMNIWKRIALTSW